MAKNLATWAQKHDMSIYMRNAGPTVMGLMSKAAELADKRVNLDAEIDLARATLMRAVEYWSLALEAGDRSSEETKMLAERLIKDGLDLVAKIVSAQAKIRLLDQGSLQLSSVSWVVGEVTRVIEEEVRGKSDDLADKVVRRIAAIKLPEDGNLAQFTLTASNEAFL